MIGASVATEILRPVVREDFILSDLRDRYASQPTDTAFGRLYTSENSRLSPMFASFHQRLNGLFEFMNEKKQAGGHYNADQSRELLDLMTEIDKTRSELRRIGIDFSIAPAYRVALDKCKEFLTRAGGSTIPDDFGPIEVERYQPMFYSSDYAIRSQRTGRTYPLQLVGEGSYAVVHKYFDEECGMFFAVKRARSNLPAKDLERFRAEYRLLRKLSFPYIVQAYKYNDSSDSYTMEYCDATLDKWVKKNNARLSLSVRKRVALQFLYGVNYLQFKGIFHRDISRKNILVKQYDFLAVIVKLSDFGLHKDPQSGETADGFVHEGNKHRPDVGAV
jgi:hypothetical protein